VTELGVLAGRRGVYAARSARIVGATAVACAFAALAAAAGAAADAKPPVAAAARAISLSETAHLHLTSKDGFTLNEAGSTSGTIGGAMYIHLHVANNRGGVTAEVNIYPRGGSLTGFGSASYQVQGAAAVFSGTLSIKRGTGTYANARASQLRFTGSIQRRSDAVAVRLSGPLSV
jgi:hypothetical protein